MGKVTIDVLIDGGKASPGPPLGNQLGPLKVNVGKIVAEINEKTKEMAGMKIPVKVTVDTDTKEYTIEIGTPPVSALIKKELGLEKGSSEPKKNIVGTLTFEQVKKIARMKFGSEDKSSINQVIGTARSMGVSVESEDNRSES